MNGEIDQASLDQMFHGARSRNWWSDRPVSEALLRRLYDLVALGPTTANTQPARFVFLTSEAAKQRLAPALSEGNRAKTMKAPAVAIIAYDTRFFELMAEVFPHKPEARAWFEGDKQLDRTSLRNSSIEGGYLILAARALGLDCGPMSGFKEDVVNAEFFPDGRWRVNFICNLGFAEGDTIPPRLPRLPFDTACRIL